MSKTARGVWLSILLIVLLLTACTTQAVEPPSPSPSPTLAPIATIAVPRATTIPTSGTPVAGGTVRTGSVDQNIAYCTGGGVDLKADLHYPKTGTGSAPVVLFVHGGAWVTGDKAGIGLPIALAELTSRGFAVFSIDYRLAPEHKFPAQIEDVKCAVRFLRANAAKYGIDPNRIGAWGGSAGAHLVSLLGLTDASAGFDGSGGYAGQSSQVRAVVDMYGPSDLPELYGPKTAQGAGLPNLSAVFGVTDPQSPILRRASPVTYVTKDAPPFLILQGDKDNMVPPSQSQELYDKLISAGARATLVMVKNAGHGFTPAGGTISPTLPEIAHQIGDFFDQELKSQ